MSPDLRSMMMLVFGAASMRVLPPLNSAVLSMVWPDALDLLDHGEVGPDAADGGEPTGDQGKEQDFHGNKGRASLSTPAKRKRTELFSLAHGRQRRF